MSDGLFTDVRMKGFGERAPVPDVLRLLDARTASLGSESISSAEAMGRVLAESVTSPVDVPGFDKSAMDGYAVNGRGSLEVVGASLPAKPFLGRLEPGQAVSIMTGAQVPLGAVCVIPAEVANEVAGRVTLQVEPAPGRHVIRTGEDVARGAVVLEAGRTLRPADVGLLAAIGAARVNVVKRPRVAMIVTGDELLPPGSAPHGTFVVDSNSPMLAALIVRDGGVPLPVQYVKDNFDRVRDAIRTAAADVVLISGGTSVGQEDHAPRAIATLGELAVHGIAIKPAAPAGIGFLKDPDRLAFLMPGNPVSCLCAYDVLAGRAIRALGGRSREMPYRTTRVPLGTEVRSAPGRVDYLRVKLERGRALVLPGGSSRLGLTATADGFLLISPECERLDVGDEVEMFQFE